MRFMLLAITISDICSSPRFHRFRQLLDCEMKMSTRKGIGLSSKKNEKEAITEEEDEMCESEMNDVQNVANLDKSVFNNCDVTFVVKRH